MNIPNDLSNFSIKEFFNKLKLDIKEICDNDVFKMLIGAGCFRFVALFAIRLFPAIFFARVYPEYSAEFS